VFFISLKISLGIRGILTESMHRFIIDNIIYVSIKPTILKKEIQTVVLLIVLQWIVNQQIFNRMECHLADCRQNLEYV